MSKKRTIAIAAGLSALMMACAGAANTATATPTGNSIYVDGTKVNGAAYMINSNNYFKLRDIAAMVNGSAKQFEVSWNQNEKHHQQGLHRCRWRACAPFGDHKDCQGVYCGSI